MCIQIQISFVHCATIPFSCTYGVCSVIAIVVKSSTFWMWYDFKGALYDQCTISVINHHCCKRNICKRQHHYWKWAIDGNSCKVGTSSKLLIQSEYLLYILSLYPETVAFPVVSGKYLVCFRCLLEIAHFLWNVINRTGSKTFNLRNSRSLMRRQKQYWKWRELMRLYTGCCILICYHYRRYTNDFIFFSY